ncbi:MAG: cytochrome c oxidase assembly protein [Candidatus Accumulibacter sp.]|uniref:cytochrome c oxidase assembly protein n=1 Tax=Accumulibacter sp. TaxID=2053492 RepID=UPI0019FE96F1|nr:cytochrome c oxidase assembly protein [Accumulibacter sp.]MBE2258648.1 cytochrome c oxidase assembly protein [Paracoccaceae bacterium]MCP5246976.1 cytochrome c oxidase assembly protein [Accumulibacter sp.]
MNPALDPLAATPVAARPPARPRSNWRVVAILLTVVVGSLLFVSLQPRLYQAFCDWTGLYDIDRAERVATSSIPARPVTLEFDANSHDGGLKFSPKTTSIVARTGEIVHVVYRIENTLDRTVIGQAIPSYGPQYAGGYVKKLDCFCFKQQTFAAHEVREMPVVFLLEQRLPEEVNTVTLSYTFFEVPAGSAKASATASDGGK